MVTRSERAKKNTRLGLEVRMRAIQNRIVSLYGEIKIYKKYLNRGLNDKWIKKVLTSVKKKIKKRQKQLLRYQRRWNDYKKRGLI